MTLGLFCSAQHSAEQAYPILFHDVQMKGVFGHPKDFADCTPILSPNILDSLYRSEQGVQGFNLEDFISSYFICNTSCLSTPLKVKGIPIDEYIDGGWDKLHGPVYPNNGLIKLPYPYIVPGAGFNELHYWNSYFSLLGLFEVGNIDLATGIIENFRFLIDSLGYIPNTNRFYQLSRSQPPFFTQMIELLANIKGDSVWIEFLPYIEREYNFWMDGSSLLTKKNPATKRVVKLPNGTILNRYWDNTPIPRAESYLEDMSIALNSNNPDSVVYRHIRAACESGWAFSSRWLDSPDNLASIETTNILPIDLNCLLFNIEQRLGKIYIQRKMHEKSEHYLTLAKNRRKAIEQYFWDNRLQFYTDYNWKKKETTQRLSLAGLFPLYFSIAKKTTAKKTFKHILTKFYTPYGLKTSTVHTGLKWDGSYIWAPLQYISIIGLKNYGYTDFAQNLLNAWTKSVNDYYKKHGSLLEVYTPSQLSAPAPGPAVNCHKGFGFGWTNGVFRKLNGMSLDK